MLDDLRRAARQQDDDNEAIDSSVLLAPPPDDGKLFGMTAVERMFLSMGIFGVTLVVSLLLLVLSESIYLGF